MNWASRLREHIQPKVHSGANTFHAPSGGLALTRNKRGLGSIGEPVIQIPLPDQLVLPLLDYSRQRVDASVSVGDKVQQGDSLGHGVLASACGTVSAIEERSIIHPSQGKVLCVVIDVERQEQLAGNEHAVLPPLAKLSVERLERAGIAGLGGAGFATVSKIRAASDQAGQIELLLINAVECEPDISCDETLIRSNPQAIIEAIQCMVDLTACKRCIIAIENDKRKAAALLRECIESNHSSNQQGVELELASLSAVYPSGAEKVLVQRITGTTLSPDHRAAEHGILCLNVGTVLAAHAAQQGYPLLSRVVSISGTNAVSPVNVKVRFGTSVQHVLACTGNLPAADDRVRAGGPLSGFDLAQTMVPVTATTHCLAIEPAMHKPAALPCIRCGACSDVCPVNLVPQQLYWHSRGDDIAGARRFGLQSCIECGCCDVVCPSAIELTATFRYARAAVREEQYQQQQATLAKQRYELRQERELNRERDTQRAREQQKAQLAGPDAAIAAALARSRARKNKT